MACATDKKNKHYGTLDTMLKPSKGIVTVGGDSRFDN